MTNVPMKYYWNDVDIETMSREQLLAVVVGLSAELEMSRQTTQAIIDMQEVFNKARLQVDTASNYRL